MTMTMTMTIAKAIILITREEWRSSQLISPKVVAIDKVSATDNISTKDKISAKGKILTTKKALASENVSATNKHKLAATFAFRGFMGNYRLRLLQGPEEI